MLDKEKLAGDIYVQLLPLSMHKTEAWLIDEAITRANRFETALKASRPAKKPGRGAKTA